MSDTLGWLILGVALITAGLTLLAVNKLSLVVVLLREIKAQGGQVNVRPPTTTTGSLASLTIGDTKVPLGEPLTQEQADVYNEVVAKAKSKQP